MTMAVVNENHAIDRSRVVVHIRPLKHLKLFTVLVLYYFEVVQKWPAILDILVDNFRTRDGMDKL